MELTVWEYPSFLLLTQILDSCTHFLSKKKERNKQTDGRQKHLIIFESHKAWVFIVPFFISFVTLGK